MKKVAPITAWPLGKLDPVSVIYAKAGLSLENKVLKRKIKKALLKTEIKKVAASSLFFFNQSMEDKMIVRKITTHFSPKVVTIFIKEISVGL